MKKKSQIFMILLVVLTVISFLAVYYYVLTKDNDLIEKTIGEQQVLVLLSDAQAQKALYYIDRSAQLSDFQAYYDLALSGGVGTTVCGKYLGYSLWRTRDNECWPQKPELPYFELMDENLNAYMIKYPYVYLPANNFDYTIKDNVLYGASREGVSFDIIENEYRGYSTTAKSDKIVDDVAWASSSDTVVTSCFGERTVSAGSSDHKGIDLRASLGSPVFAIADGKVTQTESKPWGVIEIEHGKYESRYLHNSVILVNTGDQVAKGQVIARAGNTAPEGVSVPVHIHLEIIKDGKPIDPIENIFSIDKFDIHFKSDSNCVYNMASYSYNDQIYRRSV